jgi:putative phage-type endonuclease
VLSTVSQEENEAEWLKNRSKGIGGSDIGSICGVNQYSSPRLIYLKKTGQFEEGVDKYNEAAKERMHFGHMLEPIVADEYARRTGNKIAVSPATLCKKGYPWALANVDRFIVDDDGVPYGILECKTAGEFMNGDWAEGEVPEGYLYQLMWYMWVCDLKYGAFACIVGGNKFYTYEVYFDEDLFYNKVLPAVEKFWNYNVKNLIEPELTGTEADTEYVKGANPGVVKNSEKVLEGDVMNDLLHTIFEGKQKIKELENVVEEATNRVKDVLGNTEIGHTKDHIAKWSPRCQQRVDQEKLKALYPEVYAECRKTISYRVFTVK